MPNSQPSERPADHRRPDYRTHSVHDRFMVRLLADFLEARIALHARPSAASDRALDIGCGAQPFRSEIETQKLRYFSSDVVQNAAGSVRFIAPIDGRLPDELVAAGPFAFILCTEVLEHVADWDRAFANISTLLAGGGKAIITCPQVWPLHEEPFDFWRPTIHALRHQASRAGLTVVEEVQLGDWFDVFGSVVGQAYFDGYRVPGLNWLSRKCFGLKRKMIVALAGQRWVRRLVPIRSKFYLSNGVVLQKS